MHATKCYCTINRICACCRKASLVWEEMVLAVVGGYLTRYQARQWPTGPRMEAVQVNWGHRGIFLLYGLLIIVTCLMHDLSTVHFRQLDSRIDFRGRRPSAPAKTVCCLGAWCEASKDWRLISWLSLFICSSLAYWADFSRWAARNRIKTSNRQVNRYLPWLDITPIIHTESSLRTVYFIASRESKILLSFKLFILKGSSAGALIGVVRHSQLQARNPHPPLLTLTHLHSVQSQTN